MTVRPMHPNCSVPGCERTYYARGLCNAHYLRRLRTGTTDDLRPSFEDRFWGKVDKASDPDGCWLWLAGTARGYGMIDLSHSRRRALAHRVAYELARGPIPDGLQLDHLCRNPRCVNPAHLDPVTCLENVRRGLSGVLKTHCHKGHEYTPENLYIDRKNHRHCRICLRMQWRNKKGRAQMSVDVMSPVIGG